MPMPMMMQNNEMMSMAKAASPIPVANGDTNVTVMVNGSVQMR